MVALAGLLVGGSPDPWRSIGLSFDGSITTVGGVGLSFVPGAPGLVGWWLTGLSTSPPDIDGIPTERESDALSPSLSEACVHPLGVVGFDHVVIMTSSLERTCAAIEVATGAPLKRIRQAGPLRQGFHRFGPAIVEVVESTRVTAGIASLWGLVWHVADLDDVCERLGPAVIGPPKAAVQPGRRIASIRSDVNLGVPLALMTP